MNDITFRVTDDPDGGLVASAVGPSIVTQADDLETLKEAVRDAVRCHFEEESRPKSIRLL